MPETSGTKSAGSISSSFKGAGTGNWNTSNATKTNNNTSGNRSGVGGGGGGGGGSTGTRGSSTGPVGSGNGSNAPGNVGGGGGGNNNNGLRFNNPTGGALSAPARTAQSANNTRTPVNPMGGQGPSFNTPQAAQNFNNRVSANTWVGNNPSGSFPSARQTYNETAARLAAAGALNRPQQVADPRAGFYDKQPTYNPLSSVKAPAPPVAMDPSIRGRNEEAMLNYKPAVGFGGMVGGMVYNDPDLKPAAPQAPMTPEQNASYFGDVRQPALAGWNSVFQREWVDPAASAIGGIVDRFNKMPMIGETQSQYAIRQDQPSLGYGFNPDSSVQQEARDAALNAMATGAIARGARLAKQAPPSVSGISGGLGVTAINGATSVPDFSTAPGETTMLRDSFYNGTTVAAPAAQQPSNLSRGSYLSDLGGIDQSGYQSSEPVDLRQSAYERDRGYFSDLGDIDQDYGSYNWSYTPTSSDEYDQSGGFDTEGDPAADIPDGYDNPVYGEPGDVQYPEKTRPQQWAEHIPYAGRWLKGARWVGQKEWEGLTAEERLALMDRWERDNAAYIRAANPTGNGQSSNNTLEPLIPLPTTGLPRALPATPPAADVPPPTVVSPLAREYLGPIDPYTYGFGAERDYYDYG